VNKTTSVFVAALVLAAVAGCTQTGPTPPPSPGPTEGSIGGTGVPWPPDEFRFDHTNRRGLIPSARFERFLYFSSLTFNPADLTARTQDLYDFYETAMNDAGWTLFHHDAIHPDQDPDVPDGVVVGGFEWHRSGAAVAITMSNYQLLGNVGWKLNLLVTYLGELTSPSA
jgi:hypothetical protein